MNKVDSIKKNINSNNGVDFFQLSFSVGDWVVWKLSEDCDKLNISKRGKIIEVLGDGFYTVTFGYQSMYGTRTGKFFWSNLWLV